jgi:hypothetical protein
MNFIKIVIIIFALTIGCSSNNPFSSSSQNKVKLTMPEITNLVNSGAASSQQVLIYSLATRKVDQSLTPNCGVATPATGTTGVGTSTGQASTGSSGSSNSRFSITTQLYLKPTGETLSLRFIYDLNQYQGNVDPQQGFALTGGVFNSTASGKQGTVKWSGQGIGYIDESNSGAQTLSYMTIQLNLSGTFTQGQSSSITTPNQCFTQDNVNCTSLNTGTYCFTQDNKTCVGNTAASNAIPISITGSITCSAQNINPN